MPYLIDGHNLIGAMPDIRLGEPNDEMKLVNKLRSFVARRSVRLTVVFDRGLPGGKSPASTHNLEVIFASEIRTNADTYIRRRIEKLHDPKGWTLITSDQLLMGFAKTYNLKRQKSADFAQILTRLPEPPDLGEWVHPIIPQSEVSLWEPQMTRPAEPTDDQPPTPHLQQVRSSTPKLDETTGRTLPKPKPKPLPIAPKPKPPRPSHPDTGDDKPYMANTLDDWMKLFGVDE